MSTCITLKEGELEKSKNTLEGLNREHQQLAMNLEKIEALEDKIKTEMTTLKEKMTRMDEEMGTFSDLETLRREAEDKRRQLEEEREELEGRREGVTQNLHEVQLEYDSLKKSLHDNETYVQLTNKKAESNFEPIKNRVLKLQWEYNKEESLKKTLSLALALALFLH